MKAIILKYLTDSLTDVERDQLLDWLKKPKNLKEFESLIRENYNINLVYDDINEIAALEKVKRDILHKEKPVRKLYWKYAVAASIVLLVSLTVFFNNKKPEVSEPVIVNNIQAGTDKATLTLEDGSEVILEKGQQYISDNLESNGEAIVYTASDAKPEITYNYLTIPRGGQYQITLSDGTEVWLNSESKIKYPTSFISGEERKVELLYGEAYFDVSHSSNHDGSKFKVLTGIKEIEVLGTEFNVKAYKDEDHIYTTLVEGKVKFTLENQISETIFLEPGTQGIASLEDGKAKVSKVDTYLYTAWKDGRFVFRDEELSNIMSMMEKWYDIEVLYTDPEVKNINFSLDIRKYESFNKIKQILELTEILDFQIEGNTVKVQKHTQ